MYLRLLLAFCLITSASAQTSSFKDDFSEPKLKERKAARGDWKFADHTATCTQDDALYAKFKEHGPIIFYERTYTDGIIHLAYKAEKSKSVVFTCNAATGHVFRLVANAAGTSIRAFPPGNEHNSVELAKGPALKVGEWTSLTVELRGSKATVKIGNDFVKIVESPHLAAAKANFSIGFAYGTLSVKDVSQE